MPERRGRLTIGAFSRRTQLTARALRHYDEIGLLRPDLVDPDTGYRFYSHAQEAEARRIAHFRGVGFALTEIRALLDLPWHEVREQLERRRLELQAGIEQDRRRVSELRSWIDTGGIMHFDITTKKIEPESVATFRWRGTGADPTEVDVDRWVELAEAVASAGGVFVASIGIANVFDADGLVDLELGYVTESLLPPGDGYISRVLDGGDFASVTYGDWAAKGAAYEALQRWLTANDVQTRGPGRERGPLVGPVEPRVPDAAVVLDPSPEGWPTEILVPIG